MAQPLIYSRPYLDSEYRKDGKQLSEWENNHPLNRLKLHIRQVHSVLEHVDQLVQELEDERDRAIDDLIALHSDNRKLREENAKIRNEYRRTQGASGKIAGAKSDGSDTQEVPKAVQSD